MGELTMSDLDQFIRDREQALLSLDEQTIRDYCRKYEIPLPDHQLKFWAGVHKARANMPSMPESARRQSRRWLIEHGFTLDA